VTSKAKDRALEKLIGEVNDKYTPEGSRLPVVSYGTDHRPVEFVRCESYALGYVLGTGGWAKGKLHEFFGREHSGKTTLMLSALRDCFKEEEGKRRVLLVDVEHRYNEAWAKQLGFPTENAIVVQPPDAERATDIMSKFIEADQVCAVGFDSIGAAESSWGHQTFEEREFNVGRTAAVMSRNVKKIAPIANYFGVTCFYCLAGETEVVTRHGVRRIADLAGQEAEILTRNGKWQRAPFAAYGRQRLWRVALRRGAARKEVFATHHHRWPILRGQDRRFAEHLSEQTDALRPGDRIEGVRPRGMHDGLRLSPIGVAAGFVHGDGTVPADGGAGHLNVYDSSPKDQAMLKYFEAFEWVQDVATGGGCTRVNGLPRSWKALPDMSEHLGYLAGWLAGYFAADGTIGTDGKASLSSTSRGSLEAARDVAVRLGIEYGPIHRIPKGTYEGGREGWRICFAVGSFPESLLLLEGHRAKWKKGRRPALWTVESVEETDRIEETYCAVVPATHVFALDGYMLTGNTNQVRANMDPKSRAIITPGGHAVKHLMSVRLYIRPGTDRKTDKSGDYVVDVGFPMIFKTVKNTFGPPTRTAFSDFYFAPSHWYDGVGFDIHSDLQRLGILTGTIKGSGGGWYEWEAGGIKAKGRDKFFEALKAANRDEEFAKEVLSLLLTAEGEMPDLPQARDKDIEADPDV
jgi:RecA/RadA recombinase